MGLLTNDEDLLNVRHEVVGRCLKAQLINNLVDIEVVQEETDLLKHTDETRCELDSNMAVGRSSVQAWQTLLIEGLLGLSLSHAIEDEALTVKVGFVRDKEQLVRSCCCDRRHFTSELVGRGVLSINDTLLLAYSNHSVVLYDILAQTLSVHSETCSTCEG